MMEKATFIGFIIVLKIEPVIDSTRLLDHRVIG